MTVNSPSGSTLQCDTWLWDDRYLIGASLSSFYQHRSHYWY